jgi:hypothetical protein
MNNNYLLQIFRANEKTSKRPSQPGTFKKPMCPIHREEGKTCCNSESSLFIAWVLSNSFNFNFN